MPFDAVDLDYLETVHPSAAPALRRMEREGRRDGIPIVGTPVARALHVAIAARRPRSVLEIGTAIGYSTAWMALALPPRGRITTIDPDLERTRRARAHWRRLGVEHRIDVINGPALQILPRLRGRFEACFIDAIKAEYWRYLEGALRLMPPGAIVLVDNLLWSGRVARRSPSDDASARALRAFNRRFLRDERLAATILPVGDGLGYAVVRPAG